VKSTWVSGLLVCVVMVGGAAVRADDAMPKITMKDGRFDPPELVVPADTAVQLQVTNADQAAIEFESFELHRERVIQPGQTITVYLPGLKAGRYPFFDDFHKTAEGAIVAR
jgi:heme/copper-type cytochrome/quinol oxidase subunit 2